MLICKGLLSGLMQFVWLSVCLEFYRIIATQVNTQFNASNGLTRKKKTRKIICERKYGLFDI